METREVYKERLLKLANFLDKVPVERFNYRHWYGNGSHDDGCQDLSCGTTACALGWAATMPEFQALGFKVVGMRPGMPTEDPVMASIGFNDTPWSSAQRLFGLSFCEAEFLFQPDLVRLDKKSKNKLSGDASAQDVAQHIRKFVELWPDPQPEEGTK